MAIVAKDGDHPAPRGTIHGRTLTMHEDIARKRSQLSALCRRFGVERLELFGSAARGDDFDPARSDVDFLVTFAPDVANDLVRFLDFKEAIEAELGRTVDLVERAAVEASRNPIRRRHILSGAELVHG
jgi:predicted nucleotidyltransferase